VQPTNLDANENNQHNKNVDFKQIRGRANVLMLVGLQGSGKTTTCTKLAYHYSKKGWKVGLVCGDTFRAGAFDQLKQNAAKVKIPFYGSYDQTDPVKIVLSGVEKFKSDHFEIIIVDTSGRHRQENDLFNEMQDIAQAAKPDMVIFVMDAAIGQAAESQAMAFKEALPRLGSIIITKMDGHARGGGALSAIAATSAPIIFIGTGEHIYDLEVFQARTFVAKMLGMGDMQGLMESMQDQIKADPIDPQAMISKLDRGEFSLRDLAGQLKMMQGMGPLSKVMAMMPGGADMMKMPGGAGLGSDQEYSGKMRSFLALTDSMTPTELDTGDATALKTLMSPSRMARISRGSGMRSLQPLDELLQQHRQFAQMIKKMGGAGPGCSGGGFLKNLSSMMGGAGGAPHGNASPFNAMSGMMDQFNGMMSASATVNLKKTEIKKKK
jgi:signal recognition particle subunit SRP54